MMREVLIRDLRKLATQHIFKYQKNFIDPYDDTVQTSWYIYMCSMIKRTYNVDVFAGDGRDFILAYVDIGYGEFFVNS